MAGGDAWQGACMAGGMHGRMGMHGEGGMRGRGACVAGRACMAKGACVAGWACMVRGMRGMADNMGYGQWAGGTHPTGMHSCYIITFKWQHILQVCKFQCESWNLVFSKWRDFGPIRWIGQFWQNQPCINRIQFQPVCEWQPGLTGFFSVMKITWSKRWKFFFSKLIFESI